MNRIRALIVVVVMAMISSLVFAGIFIGKKISTDIFYDEQAHILKIVEVYRVDNSQDWADHRKTVETLYYATFISSTSRIEKKNTFYSENWEIIK